MSIFGSPVGTCDWCSTPGIELVEHNGKDVCHACREELIDFGRTGIIEERSDELTLLIEQANENYGT